MISRTGHSHLRSFVSTSPCAFGMDSASRSIALITLAAPTGRKFCSYQGCARTPGPTGNITTTTPGALLISRRRINCLQCGTCGINAATHSLESTDRVLTERSPTSTQSSDTGAILPSLGPLAASQLQWADLCRNWRVQRGAWASLPW